MAMTSTAEPSAPGVPLLQGLPAAKVVLGSGLGMATNFGPILIYTFGTFLLPIVQETGWSRAAVATALAPAAMLSGLMQPVVGRMVDRLSPRVFAAWSFALFALGLVALGLLPNDTTSFAACMGLLGLLGAGQSITGHTYIVATRFTRRRGLALGIINAFSAGATMVTPAIATWAIATHGWRGAYVMLGIGVAVIGAVAVLGLLPGDRAQAAGQAATAPWSQVVGALVRDRFFWLLALAFLVMTIAVQGTVIHMTPLLVDRGETPAGAAGVMAVYGVTMLIARFGLGGLLDHWSPRSVAVLGCAGPLLACLLLASGQGGAVVFVAAALLGFGAGAESDLLPYASARQFGTARLGQVLGVFIVVFALGVAAGPALFARIHAAFGSYQVALYVSSALMAVAMLVFALMRSEAMTRRGE